MKSKHKWWVLLNSNRSRGGGEELSKIESISFILWEKYSFLTKKDPSFKTVPFKLRMMAYFAAQASFLSLPTVSFQALLLPSFLRMCFLDYSPEVFFLFLFIRLKYLEVLDAPMPNKEVVLSFAYEYLRRQSFFWNVLIQMRHAFTMLFFCYKSSSVLFKNVIIRFISFFW